MGYYKTIISVVSFYITLGDSFEGSWKAEKVTEGAEIKILNKEVIYFFSRGQERDEKLFDP